MSTYPFMARSKTRRGNGEVVSGMAIDDYFGRHEYGYKVTGKHHVMRKETFDKRYEMLETTYEGATELSDENLKDAVEAFRNNKASNLLKEEPEHSDDPRDRTFLLTDDCMWEAQRQNGTFYPHAIQVVDIETGQTRYIQSGAKIKFVDGLISQGRDQESYNKMHDND